MTSRLRAGDTCRELLFVLLGLSITVIRSCVTLYRRADTASESQPVKRRYFSGVLKILTHDRIRIESGYQTESRCTLPNGGHNKDVLVAFQDILRPMNELITSSDVVGTGRHRPDVCTVASRPQVVLYCRGEF